MTDVQAQAIVNAIIALASEVSSLNSTLRKFSETQYTNGAVGGELHSIRVTLQQLTNKIK